MKRTIFFLYAFMLFLVSCNTNSATKNDENVLDFDTISIPIDYPYLSDYTLSSSCLKNDTILWSGYNHMTHSIDIFDITNKRIYNTIPLENDGPNGVINISNYILNDSAIIFLDYQNLLTSISISRGLAFNKIEPLSDTEYQINYNGLLSGTFNTTLNINDNRLLLPIFPIKEQNIKDLLAISIDLSTNEKVKLPLIYPNEMKEDLSQYGSLTYISLMDYKDRIVYNFPYSSNIYIYWKENSLVETIKFNSNKTKNKSDKNSADLGDYRALYEYENNSLRFREVYYDNNSNKYIRIHHDALEDKICRDSYLMSYDNTRNFIKEYKLPDSFSHNYFIKDNKLFFLMKDTDDTELKFAIIDINNI